jgi:peroxiredoxin
MLKKLMIPIIALMAFIAPPVMAAPVIGQPAPDFSAVDTKGQVHKLSDFKGKFVVLEWSNHECPFVVKHYDSGNMQSLQKSINDQTVWLKVISSAPGEQGHLTAEQADAKNLEHNAAPTATLLDETGIVGKAFDAKTTPHMFIINKEGILVYQGAIDDNPSADKASLVNATNYVTEALNALYKDEAVAVTATKPYGCGIKYKD